MMRGENKWEASFPNMLIREQVQIERKAGHGKFPFFKILDKPEHIYSSPLLSTVNTFQDPQ